MQPPKFCCDVIFIILTLKNAHDQIDACTRFGQLNPNAVIALSYTRVSILKNVLLADRLDIPLLVGDSFKPM
jgi:hypothetical protein